MDYKEGQQQGSFELKKPTITSQKKKEIINNNLGPGEDLPVNYEKEHVNMTNPLEGITIHDPYGRVFDAVSLEPIPQEKLLLRNKERMVIFLFFHQKKQ